MSGIENTTVVPELLTSEYPVVPFTEIIDDFIPQSPYTPDIVIVLSVIIAVIIFVTVVGNLLVITAFSTTPKLRTYNNYFIIGLAIADLLVGAVDMPLFAIVIIMGRWPFGAVFCDIFTFLDHAFTHISMLLVALISLDRCVAVSDPFRHRQYWRRRSRAIFIIAIGYVIPVIIWFPATTVWQVIHRINNELASTDICEPLYFQSVVAGFALPVVYFFIPFILTTVLCARIYVVIRKFYKGRKKLRLATGNIEKHRETSTIIVEPATSMTSVTISAKVHGTDVGQDVDVEGDAEDIKTAIPKEVITKDTKKKDIGTGSIKGVRTLAFIVTAMWIAWFPAVIVTVTSPFCPSCVPAVIYSVVIFWGYMNSLINPICYALADEAFKNGFIRILSLGCFKGEKTLPSLRASDF